MVAVCLLPLFSKGATLFLNVKEKPVPIILTDVRVSLGSPKNKTSDRDFSEVQEAFLGGDPKM